MRHLIADFAPSEGRASEPEIIRGQTPPLHTANGFVVAGAVSRLFWGMLGLAVWPVI